MVPVFPQLSSRAVYRMPEVLGKRSPHRAGTSNLNTKFPSRLQQTRFEASELRQNIINYEQLCWRRAPNLISRLGLRAITNFLRFQNELLDFLAI